MSGLQPGQERAGEGAAGAPTARGTRLGINTRIVGRSGGLSALEKRIIRRENRLEKYRLQEKSRQLLPKERIKNCHRKPAPLSSPHLTYSPARKSGHLAGLMACGSVWSCPVCSSRISERRRVEVSTAIEWARAAGLQVALATLTLRHGVDHSLEASLGAVNGAYRRMQQRRDFKALRASSGLKHSIRAMELPGHRPMAITLTSTCSTSSTLHVTFPLLRLLCPMPGCPRFALRASPLLSSMG